ncbi:hypothetical protein A2U01_0041611 [Trifolium medium]|uniref:Uncharacterized protein n=1 Tax=Trifolium medium TaxID=97028 RepID=A0A392Q9B1_9FABA|nr:hypothetical protein [Trifolium medium]
MTFLCLKHSLALIVPVVALSFSIGFLGLPNSATILQPEVNIGKSLNIFKSPPAENLLRFSPVVWRRSDAIAGFSIG